LEKLNQAYWSTETNAFAFATKKDGTLSTTPTVLTTVPMWFKVTDEKKASSTIDILKSPDHLTPWGMRILSNREAIYDPTGYHFGSVWPLFTGWASVGGYKQHRADFGWANLKANADLTVSGPLGRVTEVLSGTYDAQLATSSPHQIWSSAMVISPIMRGLFGLEFTPTSVTLVPHLPADWKQFTMANIPACGGKMSLTYGEDASGRELKITRQGTGRCKLEFAPQGLRGGSQATGTLNGKRVTLNVEKNLNDLHVRATVNVPTGDSVLRIPSR
jgi:glycogen debranching enzyme